MPPRPASWQYFRIYSLGGTCSGMLAIWHISNKLTFDLLTLKVVSESRVTWATSVSILVFLPGLSVLELQLHPMYATDRRQTKAKFCQMQLRVLVITATIVFSSSARSQLISVSNTAHIEARNVRIYFVPKIMNIGCNFFKLQKNEQETLFRHGVDNSMHFPLR